MSGRGGGGRGGGRGRGEYYKNKYGGGGRGGRGRGGGGRGGGGGRDSGQQHRSRNNNAGGSFDELTSLLNQLDGKSYPAYHDIETDRGWTHEDFSILIGRAQSDPFAPPTRCRIVVPPSSAQFPPNLYSNKVRAMALGDYLHRALYAHCKEMGADATLRGKGGWSGPKGGDVQILESCQHVLEQTAVQVMPDGTVRAHVTISLPARGRTILGYAAQEIFGTTLAQLVQKALRYPSLNGARLAKHIDSIEDQLWLQQQLDERGLVAFVRNGAILPRASGVDDRPLHASKAVPFQSPASLEVAFALPNKAVEIKGMGFPKGITLICGGGFHGKSTLLEALQVGVYPKVPGDGREFCVTSPLAAKIRAEDGRSVTAVDISPFISNLPFGKDTSCFSTQDASGSTSQASNIVEVSVLQVAAFFLCVVDLVSYDDLLYIWWIKAIEAGTDLLLVDEDTCATNFMIRDEKMIQLVSADKEPITPFVRKVRSLYEERQVSSILVIGGSGDYFSVADHVVMMDSYQCIDVTSRAKEIASSGAAATPPNLPFGTIQPRYLNGNAYQINAKIGCRTRGVISLGDEEVNLAALEQIVAKSQTNTLSFVLQLCSTISPTNSQSTLPAILDQIEKQINQSGVDSIASTPFHGALARPRRLEIAGTINRFRRSNSLVQSKPR